MTRKHVFIVFTSLMVLVAISSCSSNKKCNGARAIKTPMGNM